jgi:hypothetical protein
MHQRAVWNGRRYQREFQGRTITQTRANCNDEIGFPAIVVGHRRAAEAKVADVVRMIVGKQALAAEADSDGEAEVFRNLDDGVMAGLRPVGAAKQQQRPLRACQHGFDRGHVGGRWRDRRRHRWFQVWRVAFGLEYVLRQDQNHRAGAAGNRGSPGPVDIFGDARRAINFRHPFAHRAEDATVVEFLEGFAIAMRGRDLSDQKDERRRALMSRMEADRRVHRSGTTGDETYARLAGGVGVGRGHEAGAAFVATGDIADGVGVLPQRVERGQVAFAGHAKDRLAAVLQERADENLTAVSQDRPTFRATLGPRPKRLNRIEFRRR